MPFPTFPFEYTSSFTGSDEDPLYEGGNWGDWAGWGGGGLGRFSNVARSPSGFAASIWKPKDGDGIYTAVELVIELTSYSSADDLYLFTMVQPLQGLSFGTHNAYSFALHSGNMNISRDDAGANTNLVTLGSNPFTNGDSLGVQHLSDGRLSIWRKNAGTWTEMTNVTDTRYRYGRVSLGAGAFAHQMDNWSIGGLKMTPYLQPYAGHGYHRRGQRGPGNLMWLQGQIGGNLTVIGGEPIPAGVLRDLDATIAGTGAVTVAFGRVLPVAATIAGTGAVIPNTLTRTRNLLATIAGVGAVVPNTLTRVRNLLATIAGTGAVTAAKVRTRNLTATIAGSGTVAAALTCTRALAATITGVGAVTIDTLVRTRNLLATIAGTGTVTVELVRVKILDIAIAGTSAVSAAMARTRNVAVTVAGTAAVTVALSVLRLLGISINGSGAVTPALAVQHILACAIGGTGAVTVGLTKFRHFLASITGTGAVSITMAEQRFLACTIAGVGVLQVQGVRVPLALFCQISGIGAVAADMTVIPGGPAVESDARDRRKRMHGRY